MHGVETRAFTWFWPNSSASVKATCNARNVLPNGREKTLRQQPTSHKALPRNAVVSRKIRTCRRTSLMSGTTLHMGMSSPTRLLPLTYLTSHLKSLKVRPLFIGGNILMRTPIQRRLPLSVVCHHRQQQQPSLAVITQGQLCQSRVWFTGDPPVRLNTLNRIQRLVP